MKDRQRPFRFRPPLLVPQSSPVHIYTLLFLKCVFNLILPSTPNSNSNFWTNVVYAFLISPKHYSCLPTSSFLIDRRTNLLNTKPTDYGASKHLISS